jgi:hypothetical protein
MLKVGAVSGDLVVKLALAGVAIGVAWYLWRQLPSVGEAARQAGNVAVDSTLTGPLETAATATGGALVAIVNAVGLTDYLKDISGTDNVPGTEYAPGVVDVNGVTFNGNF